jgi:hypothetical protein
LKKYGRCGTTDQVVVLLRKEASSKWCGWNRHGWCQGAPMVSATMVHVYNSWNGHPCFSSQPTSFSTNHSQTSNTKTIVVFLLSKVKRCTIIGSCWSIKEIWANLWTLKRRFRATPFFSNFFPRGLCARVFLSRGICL